MRLALVWLAPITWRYSHGVTNNVQGCQRRHHIHKLHASLCARFVTAELRKHRCIHNRDFNFCATGLSPAGLPAMVRLLTKCQNEVTGQRHGTYRACWQHITQHNWMGIATVIHRSGVFEFDMTVRIKNGNRLEQRIRFDWDVLQFLQRRRFATGNRHCCRSWLDNLMTKMSRNTHSSQVAASLPNRRRLQL